MRGDSGVVLVMTVTVAVALVRRGSDRADRRDWRSLAGVEPDGSRDIDGHICLLDLGLPNDIAFVLLLHGDGCDH